MLNVTYGLSNTIDVNSLTREWRTAAYVTVLDTFLRVPPKVSLWWCCTNMC